METLWRDGTKVYINGPGHMTMIAATPIYGKTLTNIHTKDQKSYDFGTFGAWDGLRYFIVALPEPSYNYFTQLRRVSLRA